MLEIVRVSWALVGLASLAAGIATACGPVDNPSGGNGGAGGEAGGTSSSSSSGTMTGGSSSGGGTASSSSGGSSGGMGLAGSPAGLFQMPNPWTKDVSGQTKSTSSDAIITWLNNNGGWGFGSFRIDFSIELLRADANTPMQMFNPTGDFYSPDCDAVPFPVPAGGALEGEDGYACVNDGDCHLLVVHEPSNTLYEMWRANIVGGTFNGGCAATWNLLKAYPDNLRGEGCTSADAGGFPISAMIFSADEVAAGSIDHAIRFILPNARIRDNVYVHPGTHSTFATTGGPDAPPYGVRFRLRADFPLNTLSANAQVIAKALQKHGMLLADGGNIALTAQSDRFTTNKWADLGIDTNALSQIKVTDFEVVDMGDPINWSGDCIRNP